MASARSTNTERAGFSQARDQMDKANYEVKELLARPRSKVPDDAAVVIVAGPKTDLFPQEIAALDAYIATRRQGAVHGHAVSGRGPEAVPREVWHLLDDDVVIELNPSASSSAWARWCRS